MDYTNYDWSDCTFPFQYCKPLYEFLKDKNFKRGLEIGFDSGSSALVFLAACPNASLLSVDVRPVEELNKGVELLAVHDMSARHRLVIADSHEFMAGLIEKGELFDYIYVDGDHLFEGALQDLRDAVALLAPSGVIIADDVVPNHGLFKVYEACLQLMKEHPELNWETIPGHINNAGVFTLA